MDDLLADFVAETREMLEASEGEIIAWEANPADGSRIDAIFRFVHTVKGNCGFFDFPRLAGLSHAAEDALADVRSGRREPNAALVSAALGVIARIVELVDGIEKTGACPEGDASDLIFNPRYCAQRRVDSVHFHHDPVTHLGKPTRAANFATAFGNIDHIDEDHARFDPALDHQAKWTARSRP